MSLRTPKEINDMWFDPDRSKLNNPEIIKALMGKWFMRTVPEVETLFIAESEQIRLLAKDDADLDPMWKTPEGKQSGQFASVVAIKRAAPLSICRLPGSDCDV